LYFWIHVFTENVERKMIRSINRSSNGHSGLTRPRASDGQVFPSETDFSRAGF
jgi:hypothetical protein